MYILQIQRDNLCIIKNPSKTFKLTNKGGVKCYLGMNFSKDPNGTITTNKPAIIDKILNSLGICDETKIHDTRANIILTQYEDGNGRNQEWNYVSVIGQMNCLAVTIHSSSTVCFISIIISLPNINVPVL